MNYKYWFYLNSYIYICIKSQGMIVYDTHTGKHLCIESLDAIQIVNKIYEENNLGCIELKQSDLIDPNIYGFVNTVVMNGMGNLLKQSEHPVKPIILLPILSLNLDVEKFKDKENIDP